MDTHTHTIYSNYLNAEKNQWRCLKIKLKIFVRLIFKVKAREVSDANSSTTRTFQMAAKAFRVLVFQERPDIGRFLNKFGMGEIRYNVDFPMLLDTDNLIMGLNKIKQTKERLIHAKNNTKFHKKGNLILVYFLSSQWEGIHKGIYNIYKGHTSTARSCDWTILGIWLEGRQWWKEVNFFISCNWKLKNNLCNFLVEIYRKYQKKCILVKNDSPFFNEAVMERGESQRTFFLTFLKIF